MGSRNRSKFAIEKALAQEFGKDNLTWGNYVKSSAGGTPLVPKTTKTASKTPAKPKAATAKKKPTK